jgi:hypothetical protein
MASAFSHAVSKLRAGDGKLLGMFEVGIGPTGAAFDGANILGGE